MPLKAGVIGRMNVRVGVFHKACSLVEALAALGKIVYGRIDFQNDGFSGLRQKGERLTAQPLAAIFREHTEVFDIEEGIRLPVENEADKHLALMNQAEMIGVMRHDAALGCVFALLVIGKADRVERHSALKERGIRALKAGDVHEGSLFLSHDLKNSALIIAHREEKKKGRCRINVIKIMTATEYSSLSLAVSAVCSLRGFPLELAHCISWQTL